MWLRLRSILSTLRAGARAGARGRKAGRDAGARGLEIATRWVQGSVLQKGQRGRRGSRFPSFTHASKGPDSPRQLGPVYGKLK